MRRPAANSGTNNATFLSSSDDAAVSLPNIITITIADWFDAIALADFNRNGTIELFDYLDFVLAYDQGCP